MVDRGRARIDLPATFTKQARGHTVYISEALGLVLDGCEIDARNPELVFPLPRTGGLIAGEASFLTGMTPGRKSTRREASQD